MPGARERGTLEAAGQPPLASGEGPTETCPRVTTHAGSSPRTLVRLPPPVPPRPGRETSAVGGGTGRHPGSGCRSSCRGGPAPGSSRAGPPDQALQRTSTAGTAPMTGDGPAGPLGHPSAGPQPACPARAAGERIHEQVVPVGAPERRCGPTATRQHQGRGRREPTWRAGLPPWGPGVGELIHAGTVVIVSEGPLEHPWQRRTRGSHHARDLPELPEEYVRSPALTACPAWAGQAVSQRSRRLSASASQSSSSFSLPWGTSP